MPKMAEVIQTATPMDAEPDPVDSVASREVWPLAFERIMKRVDERRLQASIPSPFCDEPLAWALLRHVQGVNKYGTALKTHNGRNAFHDAAQEVMDAIVYCEQARLEMLDANTADTTLEQAQDMLIEVAAFLSVLIWSEPFKEEIQAFRDAKAVSMFVTDDQAGLVEDSVLVAALAKP